MAAAQFCPRLYYFSSNGFTGQPRASAQAGAHISRLVLISESVLGVFEMSILTADNIGVSFGAFDLFAGITVTVPNDGKIGLIGPNGVGKTTLLLILASINPPTHGQVHLARSRRIGYLRQEAVEAFAERDGTVYQEMLLVFAGLRQQGEQLAALERRMEQGEWSDSLLEEYGLLQAAFEHAGGYEIDQRIQQTLQGLGLGKREWDMPLNHLSGGQKTRTLLAKLLLEKPDLLMLDEPTNHLDIEAHAAVLGRRCAGGLA
jgi:ATP-binding cassette subfamily F protein 3